MKKVLTLLMSATLVVATTSLLFTSCTKEGPQGPPGADGQDANATCTQCHNFSDEIVAKIVQYDASAHGSGFTFERNSASCAGCHTSQGFRELWKTGEVSGTVENPAPVGCRTCHMIHETYTAADWALRISSAFTNNDGQQMDMTTNAGDVSGNLCARCHQTRALDPAITDPTSTTSTLKPTSYRYGPHHGPQGNMLAGLGGFNITGGTYQNSYHTGRVACYDCHAASAYGKQSGGHTFAMAYEYHGEMEENVAGCDIDGCHPGLKTFDYDGKQTIIQTKLDSLKVLLELAGIMDTVPEPDGHPGYLVTGKDYPQKTLAVWVNYLYILEDRSLGVHNYKQANGMLDDGIAYIGTLVK